MSTIARPPLHRVALLQLVFAAVIAGLLTINGLVLGYSFLLGALIQIAGSAYFARLAFKYQGARQVTTVLQAMYLGQSGKILLTAVLFSSVFILVRPLNALFVFLGYVVMLITHTVLVARLYRPGNHFGNRR
jgi:ATP synthase protein I